MAQPRKMKEPELSPEEKAAREKAEEVRRSANRIGRQILTLTRNGLFVSLRFLDVALCQFDYLSSDQISGGPVNIKTIATTGQHLIFDPQYIIEQYMKDKQGLSRDYLHIVLHCIFRHPFVSENLNQEYWDLACDIAVENIIVDLDVKQTKTRDVEEIEREIKRIRGMVRQVTAEYLYNFFMAEAAANRDIEKWKKLFYRDDHRVWWEIAKQIAEELKKREAEESGQSSDDDFDEPDVEEDQEEGEGQEGEETEEGEDGSEEDQEIEDDTPVEGGDDDMTGEDSEEVMDDTELTDEEPEESEDETMDDSDQWGDDQEEEPEPEEDELMEEEFEDEYSSTPGDNMDGESDEQADPDSEREETGNEASGDGSGGGNPGDDPEESEDEGNDRSGEHNTDGMEGQGDDKREQSENKPGNELKGQTDQGKQDDRQDDQLSDEQNQNSKGSEISGAGTQQENQGSKQGEHSAGTGGGGTGTQSAWEHESGGANRRGEGEKNLNDRQELDGDVDSSDPEEMVEDDGRKQEAQAEAGTNDQDDEEKECSYMHSGDEQKELEEKWKEISERMLVDLETSSKEWGDKSDAMLQGIKKINKDKYDYRTFLQKFSTMREDIQLNDDEFDYVYYTLGMERYGNIPLIEPLEYKEVRKVRDFVIAIDTSGSCAGEVVQKFLDKTYSIFMQQENFFRKINLHIIQCDAQIQSDAKITCKEEFDDYMKTLEFKGFGGTDFRPVFEYVEHLIEQKEFEDLKGLIYFTDGNGTYPKRRPPYETAFIFVDDDEFEYEVPSWAMKLVLETSDITEEVQI